MIKNQHGLPAIVSSTEQIVPTGTPADLLLAVCDRQTQEVRALVEAGVLFDISDVDPLPPPSLEAYVLEIFRSAAAMEPFKFEEARIREILRSAAIERGLVKAIPGVSFPKMAPRF